MHNFIRMKLISHNSSQFIYLFLPFEEKLCYLKPSKKINPSINYLSCLFAADTVYQILINASFSFFQDKI